MDSFFQALREAFRFRGEIRYLGWFLAGMAVLGLTLAAVTRLRRRLRDAAAVERLAASRGLSADDLALLRRMARFSGVAAGLAMRSRAVFERMTARELALQPPWPGRPLGRNRLWQRIGRLRVALGFAGPAPHGPLLTTRELAPGMALELAGGPARVVEVTEGYLALEPAAPVRVAVGSEVELALVRPDEARYALRARVLGSQGAGTRLVVGHDEEPRRTQLRDFVRVRARRPIEIAPAERSSTPRLHGPFRGETVDVSAGGLSVESPHALLVGTLVKCTFALAEEVRFEEVVATVVEAEPLGEGRFRLRLAFTTLPEAERASLASAVLWHEGHPAAAWSA